MTVRRRDGALLALCAIFLLLSHRSAQAALKVCNRTSYVLYAAEGWTVGADNFTKGWTRLIPGSCATPISGMLTAQNYFLYARSSQGHSGTARAWGGAVQLCAKDTNFALKTPAASQTCLNSDTYTMPFAPVDTHRMQDWTATLTESDAIATDDAARAAGLDRLLHDIGYKTGNAKQRNDALAKFRVKFKIAPKAGVTELFDALETEALKASAPAGYSICNDTAGEIWTALAFREQKQALAAGWWKIPAGGCARALTQPLTVEKVFVHAEGHNKPNLVSGAEKFCVTNITFQTSGAGDCKKRGLNEVGFATTITRGRAGYTAHIGDKGLLPAPAQAAMPK
ncbi:MAG: DUF1036 domain-containing protein [Proteobacteria bacterium]|nr:DUF1036 domain-containing protein [Pseudomonadota bacterium]